MKLSIGIVSYGRLPCVSLLLESFKKITLDIEYEFIFIENNNSLNGYACLDLINQYQFENKNIIHIKKKYWIFLLLEYNRTNCKRGLEINVTR